MSAAKIKAVFSIIRNRLSEDALPCMNLNCQTGGFFSVPIIVFSCIELLAILWKNPVERDPHTRKRRNFFGNSHIPCAIEYMRKYLGQIRPEYKIYAGLLYGVYRHSLTHNYQPATIKIDRNKKLSWGLLKTAEEADHLKVRESPIPGSYQLVVNLSRLYKDVLKSIDILERDAMRFVTLKTKILRADKKLNNPRPAQSLSKYIRGDLQNIEYPCG